QIARVRVSVGSELRTVLRKCRPFAGNAQTRIVIDARPAAPVVFPGDDPGVSNDQRHEGERRHHCHRTRGNERTLHERHDAGHHQCGKGDTAQVGDEPGARAESARLGGKALLSLPIQALPPLQPESLLRVDHCGGESNRFKSKGIRSSGATASPTPICTAVRGMPYTTHEDSSWASVNPPAALMAPSPRAPSRPMPVK